MPSTCCEPGAAPPTSMWWHVATTNATGRSSTNTGAAMQKSGKWPVPMRGSLVMAASPGDQRSSGHSARNCFIVNGIAPRWPGLKLPCATMRPAVSKTPTEKSSPSRIASVKAVLRIAIPTSSAAAIRPFQTLASVIGSTGRLAPLTAMLRAPPSFAVVLVAAISAVLRRRRRCSGPRGPSSRRHAGGGGGGLRFDRPPR